MSTKVPFNPRWAVYFRSGKISGLVFLLSSLAVLFISGCAQKTAVLNSPANLIGICSESITQTVGSGLTTTVCEEEPEPEPSLAQNILSTAYSQTGRLYRYGGRLPKTGFDCAGFTQWTFAQHGISLPRTTRDQIKTGQAVKRQDVRPGDLLFYWRNRAQRLLHVGIFTGNGQFIHSPHTGARIRESKAFDRYHLARFVSARRVIEDPNAAPLPDDLRVAIVQKALAENLPSPKRQTAKSGEALAATNDATPKKHRVRKGDSIWALARRYGVSTQTLLQANGLSAKHTLRIGQTLAIP